FLARKFRKARMFNFDRVPADGQYWKGEQTVRARGGLKLEPRGVVGNRQSRTCNGSAARIDDRAFESGSVSLARNGRSRKKNYQQEKGGPGVPASRHPIQTARQNSFVIHRDLSPSR